MGAGDKGSQGAGAAFFHSGGKYPYSRFLTMLFLMVLFSWPTSGNIALPFIVAAAVFLVVYYFAWARRRFEGPRVMGGERQLEEIEREFEHAAGALHGGVTT
jgi:hypothetical protein